MPKLWEEHAYGWKEIPAIHHYVPEQVKGDGAVVIFPGGGYRMRAPHEGEGYARFLNNAGLHAFVVDYRVAPDYFPLPLADARRAVRYARHIAPSLGIDPGKIAVMGSSAGGHLAALVSTYRQELPFENTDEIDQISPYPDIQILCYPVISMTKPYMHQGSRDSLLGEQALDLAPTVDPVLLADNQTPPAFIWHTSSDTGVNVINSYSYATRLRECSVPVEMHIYPMGPHGVGLCTGNPDLSYVARWSEELLRFLTYRKFLNA